MSVAALMTLPCRLVVRDAGAGTVDEYGDQVPEQTYVEGLTCELQQESAQEFNGQNVELSLWRLFMPPDAPPRGWDAVELTDSGELYELEGDAWPVRNPLTGEVSHVEARARRVE